MSSLVSLSDLEVHFGTKKILNGLSISISSGEKLGLVGPNGAGKSSLLKVIAGIAEPDEGSVQKRKDLKCIYVEQATRLPEGFSEEENLRSLLSETILKTERPEYEAPQRVEEIIRAFGLHEADVPFSKLSGGQKKMAQISIALAGEPELLLLDEPTNHLDIGRILLLENALKNLIPTWVMVSHDRSLLDASVSSVAEVNSVFPGGVFVSKGGWSDFVKRRMDILEAEKSRQASLKSKAKDEKAWLAQGAKARSTKSKHRTEKAYELLEECDQIARRLREQKIDFEFQFSERKSKDLVEFFKASFSYPGLDLLKGFSHKLRAGQRLGVLGPNGSGKTTFINLLMGDLEAVSGTIKRVQELKVGVFSQFESEEKLKLSEFLSPDSDSVVFKGREIHVASWAGRFGFGFEELSQDLNSLSGGERARARLSKLMLEELDVLVLDEPTNDLDIQSIESLEKALSEFGGAVVLVSHDRHFIEAVCDSYVGFVGGGALQTFSSFKQWQDSFSPPSKKEENKQASSKNISWKEQQELKKLERKIEKLEEKISELENGLAVLSGSELEEACALIAEKRELLESLYLEWEALA